MLSLLEKLAKSDETVVREQAASSLAQATNDFDENDVQNIFVPLVLRLAQSEWFPGRASACLLFNPAYAKAGSHKEKLRKKFLSLCAEDTPLVRRVGTSHLG